MRRKLLAVNAVLAGMIVLAGAELYRQYLEAEARYALLEDAALPGGGSPGGTAEDKKTVRPADYLPIVERMLFAADRNPIIEVVAPAPVEVQRPPLPTLAGVVDFGGRAMALMSPESGRAPEWVEIGQKVGQYVLAAVESERVKLKWNDEEFWIDQAALATRNPPVAKAQKKASRGGAGAASPPAAAVNLTQQSEAPRGQYKIGDEFLPGRFRADPKDGAEDGVEYQGYVKRVRRTPFGVQAWWEKKEK